MTSNFDITRYGSLGPRVGSHWHGATSDGLHRWLTMDDVERANEDAGQFFFSPSTKRFFRSRISSVLYQGPGGYYFVTSEQFVGSDRVAKARRYTVRRFNPATAGVGTVGPFNETTWKKAHYAAAKLAAGVDFQGYGPGTGGAHDSTGQ